MLTEKKYPLNTRVLCLVAEEILQDTLDLVDLYYELLDTHPVRIRVRIDPPHPLVCRKRRLNGAVLRMRPEKPRSRVTEGGAR
jgi:hypothetical protein